MWTRAGQGETGSPGSATTLWRSLTPIREVGSGALLMTPRIRLPNRQEGLRVAAPRLDGSGVCGPGRGSPIRRQMRQRALPQDLQRTCLWQHLDAGPGQMIGAGDGGGDLEPASLA